MTTIIKAPITYITTPFFFHKFCNATHQNNSILYEWGNSFFWVVLVHLLLSELYFFLASYIDVYMHLIGVYESTNDSSLRNINSR